MATKKSKIVLTNPYLQKIAEIKSEYVDPEDDLVAPTDPEEFLDWWWSTKASICQKCVLSENRTTVVRPDGNSQADIMILGEGPGLLEDLSGVPMAGIMELRGSRCGYCTNSTNCYSSRLLKKPNDWGKKKKTVVCNPNFVNISTLPKKDAYVKSVGAILDGILLKEFKFAYPRHNWIEQYNKNNPENKWLHHSPFFISNAVLCRSTDITRLNDEAPPSAAKDACKYHLTYQWAVVQPKIIICLGREVLSMFVGGSTKAAQIEPNVILDSKLGPIIFNYHPAASMRNPSSYSKGIEFAKLATTLKTALNYAGYIV